MSLQNLDERAERRMIDYLKPEDLDTEGCINLAQTILSEASEALMHAVRRYNEWPSPENLAHLETCRAFYRSDLFTALSCGVIDGDTAAKKIIKDALRGVRVREEER